MCAWWREPASMPREEKEKEKIFAHTRTSTYRLINSTIKFRNQNSSTCDFVCMDWLDWFLGPVDTVIAAGAQGKKRGGGLVIDRAWCRAVPKVVRWNLDRRSWTSMDGNCPLKHGLADGVYFGNYRALQAQRLSLAINRPGLASDSTLQVSPGALAQGVGQGVNGLRVGITSLS